MLDLDTSCPVCNIGRVKIADLDRPTVRCTRGCQMGTDPKSRPSIRAQKDAEDKLDRALKGLSRTINIRL